ncbi:MAG: hypothetical protein OZ921_14335 [Sorangiineae bacterium]|nr:hypothetical protein [Polyangiaceae bacterium]MEB2323686.1 hypothetical protein [Sorangiineae bacterium]
MMRRPWVLPALVVAVSCGTTRPSATPLGRGPLAGPESEDVPEAMEARRHRPNETYEVAAVPDAGPPEASVASKASAKPDAGRALAASPGAATPGTSAPGAFAGDYRGEDVTEMKMGTNASAPQKDPNARIVVSEDADGALAFKLVASNDGSTICTLKAPRPTGATTALTAGQHCFDQPDSPMQSLVTSGSATFTGSRLVFVLAMAMTVDLPDMRETGSIDYRFDGKRN